MAGTGVLLVSGSDEEHFQLKWHNFLYTHVYTHALICIVYDFR